MSKLTRDTATAARADLSTVGPGSSLPRVLEYFEAAGRRDAATAWDFFTETWNWAAPLTAATPVTGDDRTGPLARPVPGGFALSGRWRLPAGGQPEWLVMPLTASSGRHPGATSTPQPGRDLFVLPARVLARETPAGPAVPGRERTFDLAEVYVPAGLATRRAGTPLRAADRIFLGTAVTAMALGAAHRVTDALAGIATGAGGAAAARQAAARSELAAVLHDERSALAAALYVMPDAEATGRPSAVAAAAAHLPRVARAVRYVITAAYERSLQGAGQPDERSLVPLIDDAALILQCIRFAVEELPPAASILA